MYNKGSKGDWDFRISDLDKNPDGTDIFNPCGEFRWSPEGPVSQIHSPHLLVGASGIFSDNLRFVYMVKREWGAESNGSYRTYSSLVKLQPRFLSLQWKTCLWAELQPWCQSLQRRTCPWVEHWWWWWWWWWWCVIIKNITLTKMENKFQFFNKTGQRGVLMKSFETPGWKTVLSRSKRGVWSLYLRVTRIVL